MDAKIIENIAPPNTDAMTEFLSCTLATFVATSKIKHRKWSKLKVAEEITGNPRITGSISDTTLGRFMDPTYPQDPNPETLRMVAQFLLLNNVIDLKDYGLHAATPELRLASALSALLGVSDGPKQTEFLRTIAGHYRAVDYLGGYLLFRRLMVFVNEDVNVALSDEFIRLYRIGDDQAFRDRTNNLDWTDDVNLSSAIKASGGEEVDSIASSGFVIVGAALGAILLRAPGRGNSGVLNISTIEFDDDDQAVSISGSRNSGWAEKSAGDIVLPVTVGPKTPPLDIIKHLARDGSFQKQSPGIIRKLKKIVRKPAEIDDVEDHLGFLDQRQVNEDTMTHTDLLEENLQSRTPDQRLSLALEWGRLGLFEEALEAGADANVIPEGSNDPLVFILAQDGKTPWVEALIETNRCDLTKNDSHGVVVEYYPGVLARKFAKAKVAPEEAARFGSLAKRLRIERCRQLTVSM